MQGGHPHRHRRMTHPVPAHPTPADGATNRSGQPRQSRDAEHQEHEEQPQVRIAAAVDICDVPGKLESPSCKEQVGQHCLPALPRPRQPRSCVRVLNRHQSVTGYWQFPTTNVCTAASAPEPMTIPASRASSETKELDTELAPMETKVPRTLKLATPCPRMRSGRAIPKEVNPVPRATAPLVKRPTAVRDSRVQPLKKKRFVALRENVKFLFRQSH